MSKTSIERLQFWEYDGYGKPKILQGKLVDFLESKGFVNIKINNTNYVLVRRLNNRVSESSVEELTGIIRDYLKENKLDDIYEVFARGVGNYLTSRKLGLFDNIELIDDRDEKDSSRIFYQNCFVKITAKDIRAYPYDSLEGEIWENRLLKRNFEFPKESNVGQFESFCWNLSKKNDKRFEALKVIIGYLLHRNRDRGEDKAIILYDEIMGESNHAHGGTGKTLLCEAINQIREVIIFDGKDIKIGSWFRNQRINLTTDVMVYDDLNKLVSLENFFPMITSGIEVEQKRKQAFYIRREKSPKIIITSNYLVSGPGGSSDERRRHEFELANHYSNKFRPEDEFGNRFFESQWSDNEWHKFYYFMMQCIQLYLHKGLINVESINLLRARKEDTSCKEFIEFADLMIEHNKWMNKRDFDDLFKKEYPQFAEISSKMLTKWLTAYAFYKGGKYHIKSTGGKYLFIIKMNHNEKKS